MSDIGTRRAEKRRALQDAAVEVMKDGTFQWCRARLLHAIAGAARQGVLQEVLEELIEGETYGPFDDSTAVLEAMLSHLRSTGWLSSEESPP